MVKASGACAVCASPANITEWRPLDDWLAVEGCPCSDFFISKWLWAGRLRRMRNTRWMTSGSQVLRPSAEGMVS